MRHRKSGRKLGRNAAHRRALFRNMVASILMHGRIETTIAKAKELRSYVEPVITRAIRLHKSLPTGKRKPDARQVALSLHVRRLLARCLPTAATMKGEEGDRLLSRRDLVAYLVDDVAPRYLTRPGGYTRIRRLGFRKGDNAPLAILELVPSGPEKEETPKVEVADKKPRRAGFFRRSKAEAAAEDAKRDKKAEPAAEEKPEKRKPEKKAAAAKKPKKK